MFRLLPVALLCGAALTITLFALLELMSPAADTASASIGTTVHVGGVAYTTADARPLESRVRDDAQLMEGSAPAPSDPRQMSFGVFLVATNDGSRPAAMARRIVLRDVTGRTYEPVTLPATNPYRYRPHTIAAGAQAPGSASPAGRDLAAGGGLILFRIPRSAYEEGPLEVSVGAAHADLQVSSGGDVHLTPDS